MAKLTPEQFADKHNRRTKAALEDMRAGIEAVDEAPTAKAAAKQEKMRQRLLEALESGKWANGLKRVSLEEWKQKMIELGLNRVAAALTQTRRKWKSLPLSYCRTLKPVSYTHLTLPTKRIV